MKINTNGTFDSITKDACLGCIARNHSSKPLGVMGKRFTCYSALEAEALAVEEAVHWACCRGSSRIVTEIDSKIIFETLTTPETHIPWQIRLVLHKIKQEKSKFHMLKTSPVHRSTNQRADKITYMCRRGLEVRVCGKNVLGFLHRELETDTRVMVEDEMYCSDLKF